MAKARKKTLPKVDPLDPWMTLPSAAKAIGESRLSILTRIVKGELVGQHVGGQTFVRRDTVDTLRNSSAA